MKDSKKINKNDPKIFYHSTKKAFIVIFKKFQEIDKISVSHKSRS